MSDNSYVENEVCEACGAAGEVGYIIKEGDEVAEVTILANSKSEFEAELAKYVDLAKQVNSEVQVEASPITEDTKELNVQFRFDVSAEKIIFELRSRSLAR